MTRSIHPSLRLGVIGALVVFVAGAQVDAREREVARADLRRAIEDGRALPFSSLQATVEDRMDGRLVDVALFDLDDLFYRVLVRQPDGRLVSAVLDARSGAFLPVSTETAQRVQNAARAERAGSGIFGARPAPGQAVPGSVDSDSTAGSQAASQPGSAGSAERPGSAAPGRDNRPGGQGGGPGAQGGGPGGQGGGPGGQGGGRGRN